MPLFQCSIGSDDHDDDEIDLYANVWDSFITTVTIFGSIGMMCYICFEVFRSNRVVFASRGNRLPHRVPDFLPEGPFRWIKALHEISDAEVLKIVGVDGYVFLRFLAFCLRVCFASCVVGLAVLMPIYSSAGSVQSTFGSLTMDNVPQHSGLLYYSVASTYLLVIGVMLGIDCECRRFVAARSKFMTAGDVDVPGKLQMMYTCLVEGIPTHLRSETALFKYFEELFPGQVLSTVVHLNLNDTKLEKSIAAAKNTRARLSSALAVREYMRNEFAAKGGKDSQSVIGPTETILSPIWCQGSAERAADARDTRDGSAIVIDSTVVHKTVVACPYYERRLEEANMFIAETQAALKLEAEAEESVSKQSSTRYSSSGVVAFKSKTTATVATQVLLCNKDSTLRVFPAPDPRDIVWENSTVNIDAAKRRADFVSFIIKLVGVFVFIPILVFCNAFGDIDELAKVPGLGGLGDLKPDSSLREFITGQVTSTTVQC